MSSNQHHQDNDELKAIQQALAAFSPQPPQVNRDRLMFLAGAAATRGQESGVGSQDPVVGIRRKTWLWPTATLSLGATSLALALALFLRSNSPPQVVYVERPAPATSPRIATLPEPSPPPEPAPEVAVTPQSALRPAAVRVPADNYLRSRDVALRMGLDALGGPRASGGGSAAGMTYLDWLAGLDRETSRGDQPAGAPRVDSALPQM